jgi:hypothetical protein
MAGEGRSSELRILAFSFAQRAISPHCESLIRLKRSSDLPISSVCIQTHDFAIRSRARVCVQLREDHFFCLEFFSPGVVENGSIDYTICMTLINRIVKYATPSGPIYLSQLLADL